MEWKTPKVDWQPGDGVRNDDLIRIEGNIDYLYNLGTYKEQYVYGVIVDTSDPNPAAVTYTDDCRGFVPAFGHAMGSWFGTKLWRDIKPCVLNNNGTVNYYLNKNNFNLKAEGTNVASVLTGADGQVMIEIPKLWWEVTKLSETQLHFRFGNYKFSEAADCWAHKDGTTERANFYIGAYKGSSTAIATSTLDSISGALPVVSQTITTFRAAARRRGARWNNTTYFARALLGMIAMVMYKHRDLKTALGKGWSYGNTAYGKTTGNLNNTTFCYGFDNINDGKQQMKFLGMEDFWGGIWEFTDGLMLINWIYYATTFTSLFNDTGAGWELSLGSGLTSTTNSGTYMRTVKGTSLFPFLVDGSAPDQGMLSSEIHDWSTGFWFNADTRICLFGGSWAGAGRVGPFCCNLHYAPSLVGSDVGARVFYL